METRTQEQMIADHLNSYGYITPLDALREYGCYRLGAIIFKLRAKGVNIETEILKERSQLTGRPVQFAKYKLKHTEQC